MKIEGRILDSSDITQETKVNRSTGAQELQGSVSLVTSNPTAVISVRIAPELWESGKAGETLRLLVGKLHTYEIDYRTFSFGDKDGKHVSMQGFHLFSVPDVKG